MTGPSGRNSLPFSCSSCLRALLRLLGKGNFFAEKNKPINLVYEIELPQAIVETFARFLAPEIRKYYDNEQDPQEYAAWQEAHDKTN